MKDIFEFHKLTNVQIDQFIKITPQPVIVYAIGSIEQHGPHLPIGTDYLSSFEKARIICEQTDSILLTTHLPGYSPQHEKFSGTISFSYSTLMSIYNDVFKSLYNCGFRKILILNSHGTNAPIIETAIIDAKSKYKHLVIAYSRNNAGNSMTINRINNNFELHACSVETSIAYFFFPALVDESALPMDIDNRPANIKEIQNKSNIDDVDIFLIQALSPLDYSEFSKNGIIGKTSIKKGSSSDYSNHHNKFIDYYISFINRLNSIYPVNEIDK